jgi:hypothetical protein
VTNSRLRVALAAIVLLLVALPNAAQAQDEAITSATPDTVRSLREDVVRDRSFAEQQLDRARQWRELEANARRYAGERSDPADKKSWLDSAQLYDKYARDIEEYAQKLRAQADAAEARANRLDAALGKKEEAARPPAPPPTTQATSPPQPATAAADDAQTAYRVEDVLGFWQTRDAPAIDMAIVAERTSGGRATSRLVAHTNKREWKGTFEAATSGPVVRLTHRPTAAEMNPAIPLWARQAAEGKLVWRIELTPEGENFDFFFKGKWFAGEVRWNSASSDPKSVEVSDEKTPYEFQLELNHGIAIDALELPTLSLQAAGQEYDADVYPISSLTMGQLFSPRLTVPAEMAKSTGSSMTVEVKSAKSGSTEQVVLKMRGVAGSGPVTYLPDQPVMISDDCSAIGVARRNPPTASVKWFREKVARDRAQSGDSLFWTWIAGDDPGPCLELDAEVGEAIEFRVAGAFIQVPLYPSWVQHGLARHKILLARLRMALQSVSTGMTAGGNVAAARLRLRMLDNYEKLIASDKLTDIHRFNLGELYLGDTPTAAAIVLKTDDGIYQEVQNIPRERPDPSFLNPLMKTFLEGLTGEDLTPRAVTVADGIQWTSGWENTLVRDKLVRTSDEIATNAVREYVKNFTFGGYEGYALWTGGAQIWIVASGTDHHGNPVTGWERFFAAVGLASTGVLTMAGAQMAIDDAFRSTSWSATMGTGLRSESTLLSSAARSTDEVAKGTSFTGIPPSLAAAEREGLVLRTVADPGRSGTAVSCAVPGGKAAVTTLMESRRLPGNTLSAAASAEKARITQYMRDVWGQGAKLVGEWTEKPIIPLQEGPTCQGGAANYLAYKGKGIVRTTSEARRKMVTIMREQVEEFDMQPGGVSFGRRARQGTRSASDFLTGPGWREGFDNLAARDYLRSMGAKVTEILPAENAKVKLRHIWSALQKNYGVKVVVDFSKSVGSTTRELHAVVVENVIGTTSGGRTNISAVQIYDSNIGRLIEVPARDFNRLLARDWAHGGILTIVRFPPAK